MLIKNIILKIQKKQLIKELETRKPKKKIFRKKVK